MKIKILLGGFVTLVLGALAITARWGCHGEFTVEDVTPESARHGWAGQELANKPENQAIVAQMPPFQIEGVVRDNSKSDVRLWLFAKEVNGGKHLPNYRQEIGDCVSFGAKNAVNYLQAVQIARDWQAHEFKEVYPPYIYGISRVQIGRGRLSGDGSLGVWAAKGVQEYGVLASSAEDVPKYSGSIARSWGRNGPPEKFIQVAKENLVKTVSPVRSAQDVCDAICNGYPCTIASNFGTNTIRERDGRMVATWNGSWAHQMSIVGYDGDEPSGERYFYVLNSWGESAHPEPLQGEPPGGFWITWDACDKICRQGDSFAFSAFNGFPSRDLDFHIFAEQPPKQAPPGILGDTDVALIVLMIFVVFASGLLLCSWLRYGLLRRVKARSFLPILLMSGLVAGELMAHEDEIDFRILGTSQEAAEVPIQDLDFHVLGTNEPESELIVKGLDFHLLCDPEKCLCGEGQDCVCGENCKCPGCQKNAKKEVKWEGKPSANGHWAKLVCADTCGPCQVKKKDLAPFAKHIALENYATTEEAGEKGYTALPYAYLYEGEKIVHRLHPSAINAKRIEEWIKGEGNNQQANMIIQSMAPCCPNGSCQFLQAPY